MQRTFPTTWKTAACGLSRFALFLFVFFLRFSHTEGTTRKVPLKQTYNIQWLEFSKFTHLYTNTHRLLWEVCVRRIMGLVLHTIWANVFFVLVQAYYFNLFNFNQHFPAAPPGRLVANPASEKKFIPTNCCRSPFRGLGQARNHPKWTIIRHHSFLLQPKKKTP